MINQNIPTFSRMLECYKVWGIIQTMRNTKTNKQMERHFKGIANHYRIGILLLVNSSSEITLEEIVEALNANFKTISEHTRRLVQAGLLNKKYRGRKVLHSLSPYGKQIISFIKLFQHS